jgi:toxin ParE1/3/4
LRVRYTENASVELTRIFEYIARDNPLAADAVARRVEDAVAKLALFPGMGRSSEIAGVFVVPLVRYPYMIYYAVDGDELIVLHVHHGARLPPEFHEPTSAFRR